MSKINKIICDICQKEIDVAKGMSLFERIEVKHKNTFLGKASNEINENDIQKKSLDMCDSCSSKIIEYIEQLKKDNTDSCIES